MPPKAKKKAKTTKKSQPRKSFRESSVWKSCSATNALVKTKWNLLKKQVDVYIDRSRRDLYTLLFWKSTLLEFVAAFTLVVLGCSSLLTQVSSYEEKSFRFLRVLCSFSLVYGLLAHILDSKEGALANPAVTLAKYVTNRISLVRMAVYFVVQIGGSLSGFQILQYLIRGDPASTGLAATVLRDKLDPVKGFVVELTATCVVVFVYFSCYCKPRVAGRTRPDVTTGPYLVAMAVAGCFLFAFPYTGASMNPARSLAPAFISGTWSHHWVYWAGPLTGGLLGALMHEVLMGTKSSITEIFKCCGPDFPMEEVVTHVAVTSKSPTVGRSTARVHATQPAKPAQFMSSAAQPVGTREGFTPSKVDTHQSAHAKPEGKISSQPSVIKKLTASIKRHNTTSNSIATIESGLRLSLRHTHEDRKRTFRSPIPLRHSLSSRSLLEQQDIISTPMERIRDLAQLGNEEAKAVQKYQREKILDRKASKLSLYSYNSKTDLCESQGINSIESLDLDYEEDELNSPEKDGNQYIVHEQRYKNERTEDETKIGEETRNEDEAKNEVKTNTDHLAVPRYSGPGMARLRNLIRKNIINKNKSFERVVAGFVEDVLESALDESASDSRAGNRGNNLSSDRQDAVEAYNVEHADSAFQHQLSNVTIEDEKIAPPIPSPRTRRKSQMSRQATTFVKDDARFSVDADPELGIGTIPKVVPRTKRPDFASESRPRPQRMMSEDQRESNYKKMCNGKVTPLQRSATLQRPSHLPLNRNDSQRHLMKSTQGGHQKVVHRTASLEQKLRILEEADGEVGDDETIKTVSALVDFDPSQISEDAFKRRSYGSDNSDDVMYLDAQIIPVPELCLDDHIIDEME